MSFTRVARPSILKIRPASLISSSSIRFNSSSPQSLIKESTSLSDFRTLLGSKNLIVTDFYATWCAPCKAIAPILEKLSVEYKDNVQFVKVDVDSAGDIAQEYGVSAMPTFVLFKDGEAIGKIVGANPGGLKQAIEQYK